MVKKRKIGCITGVDTRVLTKQIRSSGVGKALIHFPAKGNFDSIKNLKKMLISFPEMAGIDLASDVSTKAIYIWKNGIKLSFKKKRLKSLSL